MPAREWLMASVCRAVDRRRGCGSGRAVAGFESQRARRLGQSQRRAAAESRCRRKWRGRGATHGPRAVLPLRSWDLNECSATQLTFVHTRVWCDTSPSSLCACAHVCALTGEYTV